MLKLRARTYLGRVPFLRNFVRNIYKIRYYPRDVFLMLVRIHAEVVQNSAAAGNVHTEISEFCDGATRGLIAVDTSIAKLATQIHAARHGIRNLQERAFQAEDEVGSFARRDDVANLNRLVRQLISKVDHLDRSIAQETVEFPSHLWRPETSTRVRSILNLLAPASVLNIGKVRVGRDLDGGYVMLDDFTGIAAALSVGISDDVSWDLDIASRGIQVYQFDPSITILPESHPLFNFESLKLAPHDDEGAISLKTILETRISLNTQPLLLKIDIEGDEWEILNLATDETLGRFREIVCEFHGLEHLADEKFGDLAETVFTKLKRTHIVHHVHGNNCGNFSNVGNVMIPQSLEVSFASRSVYTSNVGSGIFPTNLDFPNQPGRADLFLGQFLFE